MRKFCDIQRELGLVLFFESEHGNLYCVPVAPGAPRLIVRRFDGDLPSALIPAYVDLLGAAKGWIEADPDMAALVRVEQPTEGGRDFIARPHHLGNSLNSFLDTDPEDDPPEPPDELEPMQARFRARSGVAAGPGESLLTSILARSLLDPTYKTIYSYRESRFIVVDLKPTRAELERWRELMGGCGDDLSHDDG
jgi:hypothetical protein